MTGLYRVSIATRRKKAAEDVATCQRSLRGLKNQNSDYAAEHRQLLSVLQAVEDVYRSAPDDVEAEAQRVRAAFIHENEQYRNERGVEKAADKIWNEGESKP